MSEESQAIIRLNKLMKAGYVIDESASQEVLDAIWLKHPAEVRVQEPTLILYSDGFVASNSIGKNKDQLRINSDQASDFDNFVRKIPMPTSWEKSAKFRYRIYGWSIILLIMGGGVAITDFLLNIFKSVLG